MSAKGTVLRSDVSGQIIMRSYLSGMPDCRLGLNNQGVLAKKESSPTKKTKQTVELDDFQFHQCVKLAGNEDGCVNFVPADGEFELMRYRTTESVALPFKIQAVVKEISDSVVEYNIAVKSTFSHNIYCQNVVIKVPTPLNAASANVKVTGGKAKYNGGENCIIWKYTGSKPGLLVSEAIRN